MPRALRGDQQAGAEVDPIIHISGCLPPPPPLFLGRILWGSAALGEQLANPHAGLLRPVVLGC